MTAGNGDCRGWSVAVVRLVRCSAWRLGRVDVDCGATHECMQARKRGNYGNTAAVRWQPGTL